MKKLFAVSLFFLCWLFFVPFALADDVKEDQETKMPDRKNVVKVNIPSLLLSSYSFQVERVVKPKLSLAMGVSYRPEAGLPFTDFVLDNLVEEGDREVRQILEESRFSFKAFTPELRFYPGRRGAPYGLYLAPFIRYAEWDAQTAFDFEPDDGDPVNLRVTGEMSYFAGGVMLGIHRVYKRLTFDWWLLGPFFGSVDGVFTAVSSHGMDISEADRRELESRINDIDFNILDVEARVGENNVDILLGGNMVGIRAAGFTIGFRF